MQSSPIESDPLPVRVPSALHQVAAAFQLGVITRVAVITEGLMNRNWRITTAAGVWAVKQLLDVGPEVARQQHRAAATLAGLDLPVPAPVLAGDDSVVFIDGAAYAVLPWVTGVHRAGHSLTLAEAAALGELLAGLHLALADVLVS